MARAIRSEGRRAPAIVAALVALGDLLQRIPRRRAWIPVALWLALISALSELPGRPGGVSVLGAFAHNLGHAPLFGLLGMWMALLLPRGAGPGRSGTWPRLDRDHAARALAAVALCGLLDEIHQGATGRRDFSLLDLATDLTGAACLLWVAAAAGRRGAATSGVLGRVAASVALCLCAAAVSTWLPDYFPGVDWM